MAFHSNATFQLSNSRLPDYNTSSSKSNLSLDQNQGKRFYNYAPPQIGSSQNPGDKGNISGIESGSYSLKSQYAFEKLNEKERDLFEEYQKRINESI